MNTPTMSFTNQTKVPLGLSRPMRSKAHSEVLVLMSDLVEEINNNFVLSNSHTVEVLSDSIGKLIFTLPPLFLPAGHCW